MDDVLSEFLTETTESLAAIDTELVRLEKGGDDPEIITNVFRLMHTIKGTCGFLNLPRLAAVAHAGENVLGKFRDGELKVTPAAVTLILRAIDQIRYLLQELEKTQGEPEGNDDALIAEINAIVEAPSAGAPAQSLPLDQAPPVVEDAGFPVAAELLAEVDRALAAKQVAEAEPPAPPKPETPRRSEEARTPTSEAKDSSVANASIRVGVGSIETLMTLISELVLTRNQLLQLSRAQQGGEFKVPLQRLSRITSDLQEGVTKMRMQPIGNAWSKLPRLVRDLAHETGKKIELVMQGSETELDRQVLEMIKDPLTHMIRNSADHGIETPAKRVEAGKPETGTITLKAYHESGHIVIEIADDGRGLNIERIREKVLANKLATEAELAAMSEPQILQFIFRAGFSTAEQVTSVSGRGVGMDVVRANKARIGGSIDMSSKAGHGTTFTIKIPLTLAIVSALIVEAGGVRFAIPQSSVTELVRVSGKGGSAIEMINSVRVLRVRDRLLPLVLLRDLLKLGATGEASTSTDRFVVIAQVGGRSFGIIVDRVFDAEEIVVKPLAPILRKNTCYAGNTILGDGSVIMILDPNGLSIAAGETELATAAAEAADRADAARAQSTVSFLLFRAGSGALKAVPLELVTRIEDLPARSVEHAGAHHAAQYRGVLMPIVALDPAHAWKDEGKQPVLVFEDEGHTVGLAVDEIVDVVRDNFNVEICSEDEGLIGSAVIAGQTVDIINISRFLASAIETLNGTAQTHRGEDSDLLIVDPSPFLRNMLSSILAGAKWNVTAVSSAAEALHLREAGRKFELILSDALQRTEGGTELIDELRGAPAWGRTPILALCTDANGGGSLLGFDGSIDRSRLGDLKSGVLRAIANVMAQRSHLQEARRAS